MGRGSPGCDGDWLKAGLCSPTPVSACLLAAQLPTNFSGFVLIWALSASWGSTDPLRWACALPARRSCSGLGDIHVCS